jgi:diaminopimelate dehydrogenase
MEKIKVGIVGYGNLGRGAELAIEKNSDMQLVGIFSRRDPKKIKTVLNSAVFQINDCFDMSDKIDVLLLCGGSANDLVHQSPQFGEFFNIVDSFDNHAEINNHFDNVDRAAKKGKKVAVISAGWDPGLFSLNRLIAGSVLPNSKFETFWGKGVSQGHSDAIRRIDGVKDAKQYTIPSKDVLKSIRDGHMKEFSPREKHTRECFVVLENDNADERKRVEKTIKTMPNYFEPYDTTVNFITQDELDSKHSGLPHGGFVICSGKTGKNNEHTQTYEFSLKLSSNPEFTSGVMTAYARAAYRLEKEGIFGAKTIFDIAPSYISPKDARKLRTEFL